LIVFAFSRVENLRVARIEQWYPTTLEEQDGCPTFAKAYVGRKRWEVSNILCKRRFVVLALRYSSAAVEAVRMWEAFFALHICIA